jgi:hypothetical protein
MTGERSSRELTSCPVSAAAAAEPDGGGGDGSRTAAASATSGRWVLAIGW